MGLKQEDCGGFKVQYQQRPEHRDPVSTTTKHHYDDDKIKPGLLSIIAMWGSILPRGSLEEQNLVNINIIY